MIGTCVSVSQSSSPSQLSWLPWLLLARSWLLSSWMLLLLLLLLLVVVVLFLLLSW